MRPSFLQIALLTGAVAGIATAFQKLRMRQMLEESSGSTTNASDAVDDIELQPNPSAEQMLDAGVQETFPASDPVSVNAPSETAYEKEQRRKRLGA